MLTGLPTIGKRDWKPGKLRFNRTFDHEKSRSQSSRTRDKKHCVYVYLDKKEKRRRRRRRNDVHLACLSGEERFLQNPKDPFIVKKRPVCFGTLSARLHLVSFVTPCLHIFFTSFLSFFLTFVVCLENFIASRSSRLPIRQSSIENIYVYYMRTNHLIIIELFAHITAREGFKT